MSLLTAQNLKFGFLDGVLFQDAAFQVEKYDKIGLIGVNGSGKTSLFKLIIGEYAPNDGGIVREKNLKIGYMEQYITFDENKSLYNEVLTIFDDVVALEKELDEINQKLYESDNYGLIERQLYLTEEIERRDGLVYKAKTRSSLIGLGFSEDELNLPIKALSGGQRSKASLCKLLLSDAHLLLLDEPTNNLDIDTVLWLEDYLLKYKGAYLVVSHDRYFLDKVTTSTMEICHKKLSVIKGNFTEFNRIKQERELAIEREYEKNIAEIKRIEGIIEQQKRFNQERNYITIASKQKQIDRIKAELIVPDKALSSVHFSFDSQLRAGDDVLICENLEKAFGASHLFKNFSITVRRGEHVFLLGPNGCGKSTFLKIINRELEADRGILKYGTNVKVGYFSQNIENIHEDKTVIDDVWDMYPTMNMTEIRNALAMFLFRGDDVFKSVAALSGGEKAKFSLLKIMLSQPNFLILDEPTNHLDISSREVLEKALSEFAGTLLIVSHDRYFINKLSSRVVYLTHEGNVNIDGNYDSYLSFRESLDNESLPKKNEVKANDYKLKKEQASLERKKASRISRLEKEIEETESDINELEESLICEEVTSDYEKLVELSNLLEEKRKELDDKYTEWETLQ